jgi:hypothetical protein
MSVKCFCVIKHKIGLILHRNVIISIIEHGLIPHESRLTQYDTVILSFLERERDFTVTLP